MTQSLFLSGAVRRPTIYLSGYGNRQRAADLEYCARRMNALVLDCRQNPFSFHRPEWHKTNLADLMGHATYRHWGYWGNSLRKEGRLALSNFLVGLQCLEEVLARQEAPFDAVICFCACADEDRCHRILLRAELEARGWEVKSMVLSEKAAEIAGEAVAK